MRKQLKAMFGSTNTDTLYKAFYAWLEEPGMFKFARPGVYEYSDVYPLLYFKMQIEGMESFDEVILPFCNDETYSSVIDRHMLYVGCTRAMHRLTLTYSGEPTRFLRD